jgi:hypothetical protein
MGQLVGRAPQEPQLTKVARPPNTCNAWFSAEQRERGGSSFYKTLDGRCVEVTKIEGGYGDHRKSEWHDLVDVGPIFDAYDPALPVGHTPGPLHGWFSEQQRAMNGSDTYKREDNGRGVEVTCVCTDTKRDCCAFPDAVYVGAVSFFLDEAVKPPSGVKMPCYRLPDECNR